MYALLNHKDMIPRIPGNLPHLLGTWRGPVVANRAAATIVAYTHPGEPGNEPIISAPLQSCPIAVNPLDVELDVERSEVRDLIVRWGIEHDLGDAPLGFRHAWEQVRELPAEMVREVIRVVLAHAEWAEFHTWAWAARIVPLAPRPGWVLPEPPFPGAAPHACYLPDEGWVLYWTTPDGQDDSNEPGEICYISWPFHTWGPEKNPFQVDIEALGFTVLEDNDESA